MKWKRRKLKNQQLGLLTRTGTIQLSKAEDGEESRSVEFSFSSETPYERYFGVEVLGHKRSEVDLGELNDSAPFLKDHDTRQQIGVVESAKISGRRGITVARFGRSGAAEEERIEVSDGIRTKVSVGYLVHEMVLEKTVDGKDFYRVTSWTPVEVSTVALPADNSVGIGREGPGGVEITLPGIAARSETFDHHQTRVLDGRTRTKGNTMKIRVVRLSDGKILSIRESEFDDELYLKVSEDAPATPDPTPAPVARVAVTSDADLDQIRADAAKDAAKEERKRIENIRLVGHRYNSSDKATAAIEAGTSFAEFREELFIAGATPGGQRTATGEPDYPSIVANPHDVGLSRDEATNKYSIIRAIRSFVEQDPSLAPFEREVSKEIASKAGVEAPRGLYMPRELLGSAVIPRGGDAAGDAIAQMLRAVTAATTGGNLISTDLLAGSFIDILRNQSVVLELGATLLPGLVGDVDIPRQITSGAAAWVGEGGSALDADLTLDLVQLRPKTLTAKSKITRRMLLQSTPAIEALVRADLASAIALGLDTAAISGSGTGNVPQGILNMTGLGAGLSLGATGGPQTWRNQVELVRQVRAANANSGALGWACSTNAWAHLMSTPKVSGQPDFILNEPGETSIGRRVLASEQVPSNLAKSTSGTVLSALIYGAWNELLIGEWGSMDLFPDIYTDGDQGATILRVFQDADVAARHEDAFAASQEIVTT